MPRITRSAQCPIYLEYITKYVLLPTRELTSQQKDALRYDINWIDIPTYQRGISWDIDAFDLLLSSNSYLMGNAVLGEFNLEGDKECKFKYLPNTINSYSILVDGLQRFSIGTITLVLLHKYVLSNEPLNPELSGHFTALKQRCGPNAIVFNHNDYELSNHPRLAVKNSYNLLKENIDKYLQHELQSGYIIDNALALTELFIANQISLDHYNGFNSTAELANSFVGINTLRVELSDIDLLRAIIIEKGESANWQSDNLRKIENMYSETFLNEDKPESSLLPFIAIIKNCLSDNKKQKIIFPSWDNKKLDIQEVENFLNFIQQFLAIQENEYIKEIKQTGYIPYAGLLLYFYKINLINGSQPSILNNVNINANNDLYQYLRACYRVLIDGRIVRSRAIIEMLIVDPDEDLNTSANRLSEKFVGRTISDAVPENWLISRLQLANQTRSRRIFNACRLFKLGESNYHDFLPDYYGNRNNQLNIDHLYPATSIIEDDKGAREANQITNFAPLLSQHNRMAKDTPCASKLSKEINGVYPQYLNSHNNAHPYCKWLVEVQSQYGSDLDRQELLLANSNPNIGDERIQWLTKYLLERL